MDDKNEADKLAAAIDCEWYIPEKDDNHLKNRLIAIALDETGFHSDKDRSRACDLLLLQNKLSNKYVSIICKMIVFLRGK